jgi:hypothetical protein
MLEHEELRTEKTRSALLSCPVGIPLAQNIILRELGLPERYVPAGGEELAWDQLPDYEPLTHLRPLR